MRIVALLAFITAFLGVLASVLSTAAVLLTQLLTLGCICLVGACFKALMGKGEPKDVTRDEEP